MNKKIAMSAVSILTALALAGGATFAYFTDTDTSANNALATGTLDIEVNQGGGLFEASTPITNWQPGEERFVRFDVQNAGSLPVNLRAFAAGSWSGGGLDATKVQVTLVEFWNGSDWQDIASAPEGLLGYVYYSPNGLNASLFTLAGGATEEFRLTVKLDETAGNTYQNATFNATVTAEAKQTNAAAF